MKQTLYEKLGELAKSDIYPFHMPGHKRQLQDQQFGDTLKIDITEISSFDDLHEPEGILKEEQEFAAGLYGADHTYYIVNGSTCGILTAVSAVCRWGDTIVMARNCHKSVYHAAYLQNLQIEYIEPQRCKEGYPVGPVFTKEIEHALQRAEKKQAARAVILTSPTYEGVLSDIPAIAEIVHAHHAVLIVDEAHGAHLGFSTEFPQSAVRQGADLIVQSLHKTLPSLTQTALLHVGREAVNKKRLIADIDRYLNMFQSTSPSYILMGSINRCIRLMNSERGRAVMDNYTKELEKLRRRLEKLRVIKLAKSDDISKLVIYTEDGCLQGKQLYDILLKRYRIQLEMASLRYVIAMTGPGDTKEYYDRFYDALCEIDKELAGRSGTSDIGSSETVNISRPVIKMNLYDAVNCEDKESVEYHDACGRVSASTVCIYPPGIPLVCPGEVINRNMIDTVDNAFRDGLDVMGLEGLEAGLCGAAPDERKIVKILCLR